MCNGHDESNGSNLVMRCLYVDDLVITAKTQRNVYDVKQQVDAEFGIKDLGAANLFWTLRYPKLSKGARAASRLPARGGRFQPERRQSVYYPCACSTL
ncbi:hypothetical protein PsorP6_007314 [Peronosclerospora sorghi]|uniref:Uncharacterized protein n=1 Tax=Peronosclerospora sorghi TaxID=230839 RepID=A0ACC0WBG8_9STRA|nr:hypothetical protein PsorP6_007314 [Peronosclerospora sorghi]